MIKFQGHDNCRACFRDSCLALVLGTATASCVSCLSFRASVFQFTFFTYELNFLTQGRVTHSNYINFLELADGCRCVVLLLGTLIVLETVALL